MGLAESLGYRHGEKSALQRLVARAASTRSMTVLLRRTQYRLDAMTLAVTRQRTTLTSILSGLEPVWLITIGARTGKLRRVPVFGFPAGEGLAVLGTSYGQKQTPGWVHNLEANPRAEVTYQSRKIPVVARRATPVEVPVVWQAASSRYAGFAAYRQRAAHREIRVFILELV